MASVTVSDNSSKAIASTAWTPLSGTAQAGTLNSITLAAAQTGTFERVLVELTAGRGVGQVRMIKTYSSGTKVARVYDAFHTAPDETTTYKLHGESGTAATVADTTSDTVLKLNDALRVAAGDDDDFYNGKYVYIYAGNGTGQVGKISDYVASTKLATLAKPMLVTPDATSKYVLFGGWAPTPAARTKTAFRKVSGYRTMSVVTTRDTATGTVGGSSDLAEAIAVVVMQSDYSSGTDAEPTLHVLGDLSMDTTNETKVPLGHGFAFAFVVGLDSTFTGAVQVRLSGATTEDVARVVDHVGEDAVAPLSRAVMMGRSDDSTTFSRVPVVDSRGAMEVSLAAPLSMFGEVLTAESKPNMHANFLFGLNPNMVDVRRVKGAGGGAVLPVVRTKKRQCVLTLPAAGTTAGAYAAVSARSWVRYRPGLGTAIRFTMRFSPPDASVTQFIGLHTKTARLGFERGADAALGIRFSSGGVVEVRRAVVTVDGNSVSANGSLTITLNGVTNTVPVKVGETATQVALRICVAPDTSWEDVGRGWEAECDGTTVTFTGAICGARTGTYALTDAGGSGAALAFTQHIAGGPFARDTLYTQTQWSVDPMNGGGPSRMTLVPERGNVAQLAYQWLGFGALVLYIEEKYTGRFKPVHIVPYANTNDEVSLSQPSGHLMISLEASAPLVNTTDAFMSTASWSAFTHGIIEPTLGDPIVSTTFDMALGSSGNRMQSGDRAAVLLLHHRAMFSADGTAASKHTVDFVVSGVAAPADLGGLYFLLTDASDRYVMFYFTVDGAGAAPADPAGGRTVARKTAINLLTDGTADSDEEVAGLIAAAVDADADFTAAALGTTVTAAAAFDGERDAWTTGTASAKLSATVITDGVAHYDSAVDVMLTDINAVCDGGTNAIVMLQVWKNPKLTMVGTQAAFPWQDARVGSPVKFAEVATVSSYAANHINIDTANTPTGALKWSRGMMTRDGIHEHLAVHRIRILPGETLVFTVRKDDANSTTNLSLNIGWSEMH